MKKTLVAFALLMFSVLVICTAGCDSLEEDAAFVSANPPNGSNITPGGIITVTFDNTPVATDVEIQGYRDTSFWWELDNETLTVSGNPEFRVGENYTIIITWATGRKILNYSVPYPPKPPGPPAANFVSANPPSGSEIAANGSITLTFDNAPADVTASAGVATAAGKTVTVAGPFTPGPLRLTITWADGTQTLTYTIRAPDINPPTVTGGTIRDGQRNVDPDAINADAKIEIIFSEEVTGNIALQTEGGDDVGWIGKVKGNKGILELLKGKEIGNETTYVIIGRVLDAAGNEADISITFVTK